MVKYKNSHSYAMWKFYQLDRKHFIYSSYSRGDIIKVAPKELRRITDKSPVAHSSYKGKGAKRGFITTYIINATHKEIQEFAKEKNKSFIIRDIFDVKPKAPIQSTLFPEPEDLVHERKRRDLMLGNLDEVIDQQFNICIKRIDLGDELNSRLQNALRHDIAEFCNCTPQPVPLDLEHLVEVDGIDTRVSLITRKPSAWALAKLGKGTYDYGCLLDIGLDLSSGCVTNFVPSREVTDNDFRCDYCYAKVYNGLSYMETVFDITKERIIEDIRRYSKNILINEMIGLLKGELIPNRKYRISKKVGGDLKKIIKLVDMINAGIENENSIIDDNNKGLLPKKKKRKKNLINFITEERIREEHKETEEMFGNVDRYALRLLDKNKYPIYVRFGQRTECFIPKKLRERIGIPDNLKIALEAIAELAKDRTISGVIPTKMPEYSEEYALLMKAASVRPMISIAYSKLEKGVLAHGFPVQKRLREGLRFANAGVSTTIYIATDITRPISKMQKDAKLALKFYNENKNPFLNLQFLDIRITSRDQATMIGGDSWDDLKKAGADWLKPIGQDYDGTLIYPNRWCLTGQNYLAAKVIHPDFQKIIGDNLGDKRMCYTHGVDSKCGSCYMDMIR